MNPHDQNQPDYPRADFMLARLVATLMFGACCLVVGYMIAEARFKADPPPCKVTFKKVESYPKTKREIAAFIKSHYEQGKGWVK